MKPETLLLFAGLSSTGEPVYEEVLAERQGATRYLLLRSPGLASGLAAGDLFDLVDPENHKYSVVKRGGNLAIQFFPPADQKKSEKWLLPKIAQLGGWLDGKNERVLVFTFPLSSGFQAIEEVFNTAKEEYPGSEWLYGNVYASDGVTPLNWW